MASSQKNPEISNNELQDALEKIAFKCKPKVELESDGDELPLVSTYLASIKTCLDETVSPP